MTKFEIADLTNSTLEVVAAFQDNYATHISILLTLIFGFCAVSYVAGKKLTTFQVMLASFMFLVASLLQTMWIISWITLSLDRLTELTQLNPDALSRGMTGVVTSWASSWVLRALAISIWLLGIVAPLVFMWSVRHPKTK